MKPMWWNVGNAQKKKSQKATKNICCALTKKGRCKKKAVGWVTESNVNHKNKIKKFISQCGQWL
jgi:hypothetical protein